MDITPSLVVSHPRSELDRTHRNHRLFLAIVVPLHPPIFNWLVHRMSLPFRERDAAELPRIRFVYLVVCLSFAAVGWLLARLAGGRERSVVADPKLDVVAPVSLRRG